MSHLHRFRRKLRTPWQRAKKRLARKLQAGADTSGIPSGIYCYESLGVHSREDGLPVLQTRICPYWTRDRKRPEQESGYCRLLEVGDWQGLGLLWDQVKECGLNENLAALAEVAP